MRYEAGLEAARALIAEWVGGVGAGALCFLRSLLIELWVTLSVWGPPIAGLSRGVFVVPIRALEVITMILTIVSFCTFLWQCRPFPTRLSMVVPVS